MEYTCILSKHDRTMIFFQLAVVVFAVIFGIPGQIIDYKHRKKKPTNLATPGHTMQN